MSQSTLKQKALSATLWSTLDIFLRQALQFGVSIALARLLSPEDFGTAALLALFSGIASTFVDSGFSLALVQAQDVSHHDESTVFWFSTGMAAIVSLSFWAGGPMVALFFSQPVLKPLVTLMAVNVLMSALGSVPMALLTKRMDFGRQLKIGLASSVLSGTLAVFLALRGFGVWALATQILAATAVTTVGAWLASGWLPLFAFSRSSVRRLFAFGGFMLGSSLLEIAYSRLYALLIGRLYGVAELGLYNRADSTKQLPLGMMASVVSRVSLPTFSAAAQDPSQLLRGVRLAIRGTMLLAAPLMLGIAAVARPLLSTLFGERWLPAAPALQVLCLGGIFWPVHLVNMNLLIAQGHSRLFLRQDVAKKLLGLTLMWIGSFYGVMGIAWSQAAFNTFAVAISAYYTGHNLNYGLRRQLVDLLPALATAIPMSLIVWTLEDSLQMSAPRKLVTLTVLGVALFLSSSYLFGLSALRDAIALVRRKST